LACKKAAHLRATSVQSCLRAQRQRYEIASTARLYGLSEVPHFGFFKLALEVSNRASNRVGRFDVAGPNVTEKLIEGKNVAGPAAKGLHEPKGRRILKWTDVPCPFDGERRNIHERHRGNIAVFPGGNATQGGANPGGAQCGGGMNGINFIQDFAKQILMFNG
jgi:hypothetical protein